MAEQTRLALAQGNQASRLGELVQVDTLSTNIRPNKAIEQITAYDPVARFTTAPP